MQTFLPYASFADSAQALDYRRLGKQRVETLQILNTLMGTSKGWGNHPAVRMWCGHEQALCLYGLAMCEEWIRRGYRDTCTARFDTHLSHLPDTGMPEWLGMEELHLSHRSNLLRKDPVFYRLLWPDEPDTLPYIWPLAKRNKNTP